MNVKIAQRLAELRRARGYSQESLARELGLSRQAVSKWERAESSPDTENLIALARLYGVSLDELLRVDEEIEDDVAFERAERSSEVRVEEELGAQRARAEQATQAATAAAEASKAAAEAAQAATRASERVAQAAEGTGRGHAKGAWRSFPYGILMIPLWFVLTIMGAAPFSFLVFFTIPLYRWIANSMDAAEQRERLRGEDEGRR